jgi:hypothetical protein
MRIADRLRFGTAGYQRKPRPVQPREHSAKPLEVCCGSCRWRSCLAVEADDAERSSEGLGRRVVNRKARTAGACFAESAKPPRSRTMAGHPFMRSAGDEIVQTSVFPFWSNQRAGSLPAGHDKPVARRIVSAGPGRPLPPRDRSTNVRHATRHRIARRPGGALRFCSGPPETSVESSQARPAFRCSRP